MVSFVVIAEMPLLTLAIDAIHFKAGTGNSMPHDSHNGCALSLSVQSTSLRSTEAQSSSGWKNLNSVLIMFFEYCSLSIPHMLL